MARRRFPLRGKAGKKGRGASGPKAMGGLMAKVTSAALLAAAYDAGFTVVSNLQE